MRRASSIQFLAVTGGGIVLVSAADYTSWLLGAL